MADVELTRSADDRRLYDLAGVGTLRLEGWSSRKAMEATDAAGEVVGEYEPRGALRRGGLVRWAGRELELRPASRWRERYALADGDRELAAFDGKGWGKRPVKVTLDDADALQPGLVLFAAFVVRGLAEDAGSAAAAGASAGA
jgi:hypothetical protein